MPRWFIRWFSKRYATGYASAHITNSAFVSKGKRGAVIVRVPWGAHFDMDGCQVTCIGAELRVEREQENGTVEKLAFLGGWGG